MSRNRSLLLLAVMFAFSSSQVTAQKEGGVFTAGDLWESFLPSNVDAFYSETKDDVTKLADLIRIGNWDRQWTTPSMSYPGGENIHLPWGQDLQITEYSPNPINSITTSTAPNAANYAHGVYTSSLSGAGDANRDWTSAGAVWTDSDRDEMQYTGGMPTTLGIDVEWRMRSYTANHGHLNDFIIVELELTNTGVLDVNGDGTPDATGNKINALTLHMQHEPINSMSNRTSGRRGASGWFTGPTSGYDATPDGDGNPWDVPVIFSGPSPSKLPEPHPVFGSSTGWAADGSRRLGVTMNRRGYYYDIYGGFQWISAKQGELPASGSTVNFDDKKTIYDSHPVGAGGQRGWYTSILKDDGGRTDARMNHLYAMSAFLDGSVNGSRNWDKGAALQSADNIVPDPNWFDPTHPDIVPGDPLSFVAAVRPEGDRGQPTGDMKANNTFVQNWEVDPSKSLDNQPDWAWTKGYTIAHGFDGNIQAGIGPFSLEVGESMTVVLVEYGGFRLAGAREARRVAQWAYENNYNVPEPPPSPDMAVAPNTNVKIDVKWDNQAESDPNFAGYKVYRSALFPKVDSHEIGIRVADNYHEQTVANPTDAQLAAFGETNNPNISSASYKDQESSAWGPYRLIRNIPASELGSVLNDGDDQNRYKYKIEDNSDLVTFGFTYYYYVSAYTTESGDVAGVPYSGLESHRQNFNGRSGLWEGTYHFATASSFWPGTQEGEKDIGAPFILKAPLATPAALAGDLDVRVVPNPYKKGALHDTGTEHKMLFINLPSDATVTIFDVSGQVIDVLRFEGTNPFDGTLFWDMFSQDGVEVTSGLYIFKAEWSGGSQTGHFAILR
ncbi:MAG: T9SS type A sorting domain-containing protein [Candidatus Latescibacterota bacterium]|nr:T9SS type A sorting domain-containing protein [Candidatus Latescibacterota bacterium]